MPIEQRPRECIDMQPQHVGENPQTSSSGEIMGTVENAIQAPIRRAGVKFECTEAMVMGITTQARPKEN